MRLTDIAHNHLSAQLQPGDYAIDATAGNGHDTTHMASLVGSEGHVIAIDIQEAAINATRSRLKTHGCLKQFQLLTGEHSRILQSLCSTHAQTINSITFNLGYFPSSDKRIQTNPRTTLSALAASQQLLKLKGLLLVTAYRGHEGGQIEAEQVARWMQAIQDNGWSVKTYDPEVTGIKTPPILWVAQK